MMIGVPRAGFAGTAPGGGLEKRTRKWEVEVSALIQPSSSSWRSGVGVRSGWRFWRDSAENQTRCGTRLGAETEKGSRPPRGGAL